MAVEGLERVRFYGERKCSRYALLLTKESTLKNLNTIMLQNKTPLKSLFLIKTKAIAMVTEMKNYLGSRISVLRDWMVVLPLMAWG